jgi:hypothetical protein
MPAGGLDQRQVTGRGGGHAFGHLGHVERAEQAVQQADREQVQRRGGDVEGDVVDAGAHPLSAAAAEHQAVGGDQQHLEEHEQVEQVGGQEGAVEAHQLAWNSAWKCGARWSQPLPAYSRAATRQVAVVTSMIAARRSTASAMPTQASQLPSR